MSAAAPSASPLSSAVAATHAVSHRYGDVVALDNVSVQIPAGAMIGLIGPDGVGKSTLLGLIAGVRRLQEGRIETLGGDIASVSHRRSVLTRLAYMPQGLGQNLYPTLSVAQNVDFFARLFGQSAAERAARIDDLLAATGLAPFRDRAAGKLSGGMKQKLSLCCSLVHDPDLVILDEPTTGVDPLARRQFWRLIDRLRARRPGMSVVTATAYMEEAEGFDHLIALNGGKVLATGAAAELRAQTGRSKLEDAFVALLPPEERDGVGPLILPPMTVKPGPPAIEADGLTKRFGDFTAVDNVSLRIQRGEIFGFLGSNGCGKTTTMKMLTGLLPPTSGAAKLFGDAVTAYDRAARARVGYMSQAFSLYTELTVRQNLELHGKLFQLPPHRIGPRVLEMMRRFELFDMADRRPDALPLGVRQRLQLAAAMIHKPEMLILDEPTSGVDPVARDRFWEMLIELSRQDGVTIFISTHFMSEAERCDRISFMHAGRVLAMGAPEDLRRGRGVETLEEAFIAYLEEAAPEAAADAAADDARELVAAPGAQPTGQTKAAPYVDPRRLWAFARREAMEVVRDPIRIAFALFGPLILMLAMSIGISFDIEDVAFSVLDQDRSKESREFVQTLRGSRYFSERPAVRADSEIDRLLTEGEVKAVLVIPPDFGRDLLAGRRPTVAVWLDGANSTRAETARGYVLAAQKDYLATLAREDSRLAPSRPQLTIQARFRYNQAFASVYAIAPGAMMMMLIMAPAMLTALGVVREKELGSISNFYASPAGKLEFLIGKQAPYLALAFLSFFALYALMDFGLGVPARGNFGALAIGALCFVAASTAFGLIMSTLVRSQIAAIFGTAIVSMIPTVSFSGMLYPRASLEGSARVIGAVFPSSYFQHIASGVTNKQLGFAELYQSHLILLATTAVFLGIAAALLSKQAR
ncbi:MAG: ribosome-associated ATPase/putative transporter RbbA [Neomegalonema sp.]|nr:ribosome-associated ATPase/putative transporter RbbA [Neomegalonema sp.]